MPILQMGEAEIQTLSIICPESTVDMVKPEFKPGLLAFSLGCPPLATLPPKLSDAYPRNVMLSPYFLGLLQAQAPREKCAALPCRNPLFSGVC